MKYVCSVFLLLNQIYMIQAATELLKNADFESSSFTNNWVCADCKLTSHTTDVYHGGRCIMVTNRHHYWSAPQAQATVTPGKTYIARTYIKLLNMPSGATSTKVDLMVTMVVHGRTHRLKVSQIPRQQVKYGWTELNGYFRAPSGSTHLKMFLQVSNPAVNYLQDYASLQELTVNNNWKSEANARIEQQRKATATLKIVGGAHEHGISVDIKQTRREFAFGSSVNAKYMTDASHTAYQNFVVNTFEWAVLENALKWRLMEWTKGHIKFDLPVNAIKVLRGHGLKVRGHNMFWDVDGHSPRWLDGMSSSQLISEMKQHVKDMIIHTNGTLEHWDVNNENLHGDYFEKHTNDPDITNKMFQWIHTAEPNVKLFLNDYGILAPSYFNYTTAIKNQGLQLRQRGVPIYGIGLQSHFKSSNIDMDVLKYKLDKVSEAGLKLWITELSIKETDANKKAAALENVLTLFFSHPAVDGVLLWGFWDGFIFDHDCALFTGQNIGPNAAGQRYIDLVTKTWKTDFTYNLNAGSSVTTKVFIGDYILRVRRNGHVIHQEKFSVGQNGKDITLHLTDDHHVSNIVFG